MVDATKPPSHLISKAKPGVEEAVKVVIDQLANLNRRINLVENKSDSLQDHIDLIDNNLIDKHKASISEIRNLQSELRDVQAQMRELSSLLKRVVGRMTDYASKDEVKVMERYLKYWSPLSFTTREDVERIVKAALDGIQFDGMTSDEASHLIKDEIGKLTLAKAGLSEAQIKRLIKDHAPKPTASTKTVVKEIKGSGLTKKEVEEIVAKSIDGLPKSEGGGLSKEDIKKITKGHIEDLFGKI